MMYVLLLSLLSVGLVDNNPINGGITVDSLHIRSDVRHRFSETRVSSRISNTADIAQEVTLDVRLPNEAFISAFSMLIDGAVYPGHVEEKEAADQKFESAVQSGQSAGKVAMSSARETNDFVVSVNVAARSDVMFNLTYQELLQRRLGLYEHVIHINPGQVVPDLQVHVFINETREITELTVPELTGDRLTANVITATNRFARIRSLTANSAEVTFSPTPEQQVDYSSRGVAGQFIVNYDVDHTVNLEGEILVSDGYFVHFFAPENLSPIGKRIVFVLDTSGSMAGRKNRQLREALLFILGELRPVDEFAILLFSNVVTAWNLEGLIPATVENIARAKQFANTIGASGGTNINDALLRGLQTLSYHDTKPPMLLFLTDGQATSGVTNSNTILENVRQARHSRQSIYSLAFGAFADFELLRKLSIRNKGFARKIVEDADAALQLAGFYNEISSPLLSEVKFKYISDLVDNSTLTKSDFPTVFSGSEIMVAGRYDVSPDTASHMLTIVIDSGQSSTATFQRITVTLPQYPKPTPTVSTTAVPSTNQEPTSLERLWVYLTVKQLIEKTLEIDDPSSTEFQQAKAEALRLSLKYQFVTPYTSMIVTKPQTREGAHTTIQPAILGTLTTSASYHAVVTTTTTRVYRGFTTLPTWGTSLYRTTIPFTTVIYGTSRMTTTPPHPTFLGSRGTTSPTIARTTTPRPPTTTTTTTLAQTTTPETYVFPAGVFVQKNSESPNTSVCLDLVTSGPLEPSAVVLLNDTTNHLSVTGHLQPDAYDRHRKLQSVSVRMNGNDLLAVDLTSIRTRDRTYRWWQLSSLSSEGFTVYGGDTIELTTPGNVSLALQKYGIETRRSLSSPFISVAVKNAANLSPDSTGLIGTLLNRDSQQYATFRTIPGVFTDGTDCNRITDPQELGVLTGPLTEVQ